MNQIENENLCYNTIDSLLSMSIQSIATDKWLDWESLTILPAPIKTRILRMLSKRGFLTSDAMSALLTSDVQDLNLSECVVTDGHLKLIARCKRMRNLNMNRGRYQNHSFTTEELMNLIPKMPHLTQLFTEGSMSITDEVIEQLASSCVKLATLDVGNCPLTDKAAQSIAKMLLFSLNLSNTRVSDAGVFSIANGACSRTLSEVKMNNCQLITDDAICSVAENCPNLEILVCHGCPRLTEQCEHILTCLLSKRNVKHLTYTVF
ncbi:protein AMN1 homolog [Nilaparvata lugens]|uniref:protein AMN1 homolog n=1 Tax=Nilaparvata lugens TaxID=108931 RepID=UPI00193DD8F1|nr:protein AMN1 homolog [Nilaparvata lugens]